MPLTAQQIEQRLLAGREGFYFAGSESLRVTSLNSVTGVTIAGAGRFLPCDALKPSDLALSHTPNTDRTSASSDFQVGEGWLQSLTLIASGGSPVVGSTYVRVDVVRGSGASATIVATLVQGFVTAGQRLAWLGSPIADTVSGRGRIRIISGTDQAAGAELSETVPTGARWQLVNLYALLTTDATVANRQVSLCFDDGATNYTRFPTNYNHTAGLAVTYNWGIGLGEIGNFTSAVVGSLPPTHVLAAGHRIKTITVGFQAGDNWSVPQMLVEEWLEGA